MHTVIEMPALSPTMVRPGRKKLIFETCQFDVYRPFEMLRIPFLSFYWQSQGNIAKWRKKEGDKVSSISRPDTVQE